METNISKLKELLQGLRRACFLLLTASQEIEDVVEKIDKEVKRGE